MSDDKVPIMGWQAAAATPDHSHVPLPITYMTTSLICDSSQQDDGRRCAPPQISRLEASLQARAVRSQQRPPMLMLSRC